MLKGDKRRSRYFFFFKDFSRIWNPVLVIVCMDGFLKTTAVYLNKCLKQIKLPIALNASARLYLIYPLTSVPWFW